MSSEYKVRYLTLNLAVSRKSCPVTTSDVNMLVHRQAYLGLEMFIDLQAHVNDPFVNQFRVRLTIFHQLVEVAELE